MEQLLGVIFFYSSSSWHFELEILATIRNLTRNSILGCSRESLERGNFDSTVAYVQK